MMKRQKLFPTLMTAGGWMMLFVAAQFAASFLAGFVITFALMMKEGEALLANEEALYHFTERLVELAASFNYEITLLTYLLFLGVAALICNRKLPDKTGMKQAAPSACFGSLLLGCAAFPVALLAISVTTGLLPSVAESQSEYMELQEAITASANPWLEAAVVVLIAPLVEELLFRGLVQRTLLCSIKPFSAIVISGICFGFFHGNQYQMVFTIPLGLLLGYVAYRFDSLWPSVLLHLGFNAMNYPINLGYSLGFDGEHVIHWICYFGTLGFCFAVFPVALFLLRRAKKKIPQPMALWTEEPSYSELPLTSAEGMTQGEFCMAAPEYIIVGLGNPGDKYSDTRHNCGFMALDYIALRERVEVNRLRFHALTGETVINGKKVLLMKPQTFMNASGDAVREAAAFYRIPPERILVIFDDISFSPGVFRIRNGGSAGGHNGLKSIIARLGSDGFPRVKMGIGAPPEGWELINWVLGAMSADEQDKTVAAMEDVYATAKFFVEGNLEKASQQFNGKSHG